MMMLYRNTRTGVVIESEAVISGGGWQAEIPASKIKPVTELNKKQATDPPAKPKRTRK